MLISKLVKTCAFTDAHTWGFTRDIRLAVLRVVSLIIDVLESTKEFNENRCEGEKRWENLTNFHWCLPLVSLAY